MELSETTVGLIYLTATVVAMLVSVILWGNRKQKAALPLGITGVSTAVWAFGLFVSTVQWEWLAVAAIRVMYFGVGIGTASLFVFALEYTGRERYVTRNTLGLLSIHPILLVLFAFVNPAELFFIGLDPGVRIGVQQQWGPAFWVHSAYSYLLVLATSLLVVELLVGSNRALYRGQAFLLAAGVFVPLPLNALFLSGAVEFDTTPLGFIFMCSFFGLAIVKYQFVNISPIAREKVIDTVRDGMIVVDTDNRIIDSNPAARRILNIETVAVGTTVEETLSLPEAQSVYEELTATTEPSERTVSFGEVFISIETTPIFDDRERHVGWLFLLQDVTNQERRERDLEQQIEKLDQFASLVSHDLRNPISIANGYIEQAKITGDLENLTKAQEATARMEEIIDDVLALAREGQDVTDPADVSIETTAQDAWAHIETDGAVLDVDTEATIIADRERLKRLFENLIRNSIEHGSDYETESRPDPTELTVTVGTTAEEATELTLYVADDGVGIPQGEHDRVLEDGYSTGEDGTGLGLSIVDQIANAHGWELSVTESEAGGARFEISNINKPL